MLVRPQYVLHNVSELCMEILPGKHRRHAHALAVHTLWLSLGHSRKLYRLNQPAHFINIERKHFVYIMVSFSVREGWFTPTRLIGSVIRLFFL